MIDAAAMRRIGRSGSGTTASVRLERNDADAFVAREFGEQVTPYVGVGVQQRGAGQLRD